MVNTPLCKSLLQLFPKGSLLEDRSQKSGVIVEKKASETEAESSSNSTIDPVFQWSAIPKVHCSEGPLFQGSTVPKVSFRDRFRVSRVRFRVRVGGIADLWNSGFSE